MATRDVSGYCWDCSKTLYKGQGKFEVRKSATTQKRRMVCRDRAECDYRRALWKAREQAEVNAAAAAMKERAQTLSAEEARVMLHTVPTGGDW